MKKGINIWSFASGTLLDKFKLAADAGFDGIEVAISDTGELGLDVSKEELLKINKAANDLGLEIYSVCNDLVWGNSLTSPDSEERERAKKFVRRQLEVASILGADTILIVPGCVSASFAPNFGVVDYDVAYELAKESIKELIPDAEKYGVVIGVENVWNKFLLSPLEMRDFIDSFESPWVQSYFDVGNVMLTGYPEQWIKILGKRIKKVHFKEFRTNVGTLDGFVDLLAGDVNWKAVMEAFEAVGYDGWVTGEMIPAYAQHSEQIIYNTSNSMDKIIGRK